MNKSRAINRPQGNTAYIPDMRISAKIERRLARYYDRRLINVKLKQPLVSFSFDDCPQSALINGARPLEAQQWRATFYIAMGLCGIENHLGKHMGEADIQSAHHHGHEIADHSFSHIDGQKSDIADFLANIDRNQSALNVLNIPPSRNFAYPYGCLTPRLKRAIAQKFELARGTHNPAPHRPLKSGNMRFDKALLPSMRLYSGHDFEQVVTALKSLRTTPQWLNIFTHDIRDTPSPYGCTPEQFLQIIALTQSIGAKVLPIIEAYDFIKAQTATSMLNPHVSS